MSQIGFESVASFPGSSLLPHNDLCTAYVKLLRGRREEPGNEATSTHLHGMEYAARAPDSHRCSCALYMYTHYIGILSFLFFINPGGNTIIIITRRILHALWGSLTYIIVCTCLDLQFMIRCVACVQSIECRGFESHPRQLIFSRKSDCLGCAVLLCLVCLFDLACFFLSSFSSLIKNMYVCMDELIIHCSCLGLWEFNCYTNPP